MRFRLQQVVLALTSCICVVVGSLWTALLLVAAMLGLSAMPDDAATTQTLLEKFLLASTGMVEIR
jgi:hypothetical protein